MTTTALVFVGHSKQRLIESIRAMHDQPVSRIILILGEQDTSGERKSRAIARELEKDLAAVYDVATTRVDKTDIMVAARQIVGLIRLEKAQDREVILNMSGSLRTFAIAAYIAGCITRSKMITAIPHYDEHDEEVGIEKIVDLPALPLNLLSSKQISVLEGVIKHRYDRVPEDLLYSDMSCNSPKMDFLRIKRESKVKMLNSCNNYSPGVKSLDELVQRLEPEIRKENSSFASERSRLSHHLKNLEEMGMIEKQKKGKNVGVTLTPLGELMVEESKSPVAVESERPGLPSKKKQRRAKENNQ